MVPRKTPAVWHPLSSNGRQGGSRVMIGVLTGEGGQCWDTASSGLERAPVTEHQAPRDTHRAKLAKKTLWKELPTYPEENRGASSSTHGP